MLSLKALGATSGPVWALVRVASHFNTNAIWNNTYMLVFKV